MRCFEISSCAGYKSFLDKYKKEKKKEKEMNMSYYSEEKEKNVRKNLLRAKRGRK